MKNSPNYLKERTFKLEFILPNSWYDLIPKKVRPIKTYKNPISLAMEWKQLLDSGQFENKADLARHLGVSRVRVLQILDLLKLCPEIINKVSALGETFKGKILGEKTLRPLVCLTPAKQVEKISLVLGKIVLTETKKDE